MELRFVNKTKQNAANTVIRQCIQRCCCNSQCNRIPLNLRERALLEQIKKS